MIPLLALKKLVKSLLATDTDCEVRSASVRAMRLFYFNAKIIAEE